jgi:hypothetical protein
MKVTKHFMIFLTLVIALIAITSQQDLEFLSESGIIQNSLPSFEEQDLNLIFADFDEMKLAGGELLTLTYGDKHVQVRLDSTKTANHLNSMPINCFQFSTANPKKDYPGHIVQYEINERNLKTALREENAIQIVFKMGKALLEEGTLINPEKTYFIIGVMWYGGEFHFVRLFLDGWFSKPSKVGKGDWAIKEFKLPSEALGYLLAKVSGPRVYKFLGFYLHPNRNDFINELLN